MEPWNPTANAQSLVEAAGSGDSLSNAVVLDNGKSGEELNLEQDLSFRYSPYWSTSVSPTVLQGVRVSRGASAAHRSPLYL